MEGGTETLSVKQSSEEINRTLNAIKGKLDCLISTKFFTAIFYLESQIIAGE